LPEAGGRAPRVFWRVSDFANLDGLGGLRGSARWHTAGRRIVYLAESPAGAVIEAFVHLELKAGQAPKPYTLLKVEADGDLTLATLDANALGQILDLDQTRELGDQWLARGEAALLRVPSAILPETFNVLLNPVHADAARVTVAGQHAYPWHPQLEGATPQKVASHSDVPGEE
jgi:RES domain-containing protein